MTRFVVLEPRSSQGRSEEAVFVRDRFSWAAFLLPLLWLLWHRLFVAALLFLGLGLALASLGRWDGLGVAGVVLPLLLNLLLALEGPRLRSARLRRKGFCEVAAIQAADIGEAEMMYFAGEVMEDSPAELVLQSRNDLRLPPPAHSRPSASPFFGWHSGRGLLDRSGAR